jgi:hypothetical protein
MTAPSIRPADDARTACDALEEETRKLHVWIEMLRALFLTAADDSNKALDLNEIVEGLILVMDQLDHAVDRALDLGVALRTLASAAEAAVMEGGVQ